MSRMARWPRPSQVRPIPGCITNNQQQRYLRPDVVPLRLCTVHRGTGEQGRAIAFYVSKPLSKLQAAHSVLS